MAAAAAVGVCSLVLILVLQRWLPRVPGVLAAVVLSIVAAQVFDLASHGVALVGTLPRGLPPFTIPRVPASDLALLAVGALGIALVALTDTISTASAFAAGEATRCDANKEMIGIGAANIAAGLFQGFPVSTSGSRTAVSEQAGARTQLTGLVGAAVIVLMLVAVPGLFRNLPQPTLAAVVIAAAISLADVAGMRLSGRRRTEFALSLVAFLGVALLGVLPGSPSRSPSRSQTSFRRRGGPTARSRAGRDYRACTTSVAYPDAEQIEGCRILRFDAPLFFANARAFREQVTALAVGSPSPRWIVVSAEPITDVDTTAADMLEDLDEELNAKGVSLVFAEMKDPVRDKIERYGLTRTIDPALLPHPRRRGRRVPRQHRRRPQGRR